MAAKMTIQTRTQLPVYTAETLAAKNPVLLKGEIVYESDTGRHKLGDGTTAWNTLAYASDVEKVPALRWKVQGGMLYVKPATDPADPILKRCSVGILHYKNARVRKSSAAKLRRENVRAWRGTRTAEDDNATAPLERYLRWDELAAMDQWLLLQQKDGSLYLVMGYRSGGLPYSGAHPYRWIVRLNGGATELTRADLNGDGIEEVISYTGTSTQEPYRLRVSNQSGEELWSAELGLAHAGWSSYFLYRDSVKTALLCYEPTIYQGEASYSYELFMLSENGTTTLAENSVSFSVNSDSADSWPAEARKFADEVNRLLDKSELLFSTLNAELHSYGDGTVIRCAEPSESDGSRALASADLDNDGRAEQIICEKVFGGYELCVVDDNGEELMRDRMWEGDVYFLCRENGRDMLLQYSLDEGKNQDAISYCDYYYGLHTFDGGKLNIVENNNTSIYLNWDGTQNGDWGESQQAFAARVNELIDQSEFLIAQQDGELILTSEVQRWYCVSPKTIRVAMDDTTIYIDRKSWDFAEQYPSLKGFEDIGTAGNYFVAFGSLGEKNDLYVVFNFVAGTLLKTFPGNNLIWQGNDLFTAVYSYWSDIYALNGTKLAALDGKACAVKRMNLGLTRAVSLDDVGKLDICHEGALSDRMLSLSPSAGLVPTSIPPSVNDTRHDFARREDGTEASSAAFAFILGCG